MSTLAGRLHAVLAKEGMVSVPTSPVIPPPVITTPPVGVGSGLSGLGMLSDDFTGYSNTAALQAVISTTAGGTGTGTIKYQDGWYANLVSLDNSVPYNGHATAKLGMPGGLQNCPKLVADFPGSYDKVYFRSKIRCSPGFKITGTISGSANAYKLLGWGHDTYDGSGRLEIVGTQYQLYWTMQSKAGGAVVGGGQYLLDGSVASEWTDGGWYDYIICIDRTKGTQGTASWWMTKDGSAPIFRGTTPLETMANGGTLPRLVNVQFSLEFNQTRAASQTQAIWLGAWEVIDGVAHPDPYKLGI